MKKYLWLIVCLLVLCLAVFASCTHGSDFDMGGSDDKNDIVTDDVNRKLVYNVYMSIEVDKIGPATEEVLSKAKEAGGYVQSQSEYGDGSDVDRTYISLRIPTDKLDSFLNSINGNGKILSKRVSLEDITTDYVNATAQMQALEGRKQMLSEMLTQDLSASDKISVISEIASVDAQLQAVKLQLNEYDSLADYSTVELRLEHGTFNFVGVVFGVLAMCAIVALVVVVIVLADKLNKKKSQSVQQ